MEESDSLPIPAYIISAAAFFTNSFLLVVYFCCPLRNIKSYKYFFLITAVGGLIYTAVFTLLLPRLVSQCSSMIFAATGVLTHRLSVYILLIIFCTTFYCSVLFATNSFIYRYVQLCRAYHFERLSSAKSTVFALLVNIFLVLKLYFIIYVVFWPDDDFEQMISDCVRFSGMKTTRIIFLGFSIKYRVSGFRLGLILELLLFITSMGIISIFCALKINGFLKDATQNSNFLRIQRRMFILLQLQTAIPFTFLLVPCFVAFFLLFTGIDSTSLITNVISILLITYPVLNPVVIIGFLDEYRNFVLFNLKLKKRLRQSESSHFIFNITRPVTDFSQTTAL